MSSYDEYVEGSATAAYRQAVDEAVRLAEAQKKCVLPIYHEKIDHLLDDYARALAKNMNQKNAIASRLPSVLFGVEGLHFPADQVERQRLAAEANQRQFQRIQGILDDIRCPDKPDTRPKPGKRRISGSDPEAVQKLEVKLKRLEERQKSMKAVNAYYQEHGTLDGCPGLSAREIEQLAAAMRKGERPYSSSALTNINSRICGVKNRIAEVTARKEIGYVGWPFEGGVVKADRETNQLQIIFDGGTPADVKYALKRGGFHWEPDTDVWQRRLNNRAIKAADRLECIRPLSGKLPSELQNKEAVRLNASWCFYIKNGPDEQNPLEYFAHFETAKARFQELRDEAGPLTLGLESSDGLCSADVLCMCQGQRYLVTDFTQTDRMRGDPAVAEILRRISKEIGFDQVRLHKQAERSISFPEWDNPYFPSATPGSIAAGVYDLALRCGSVKPGDAGERAGQIAKLVRLLQSGNRGIRHVRTMAVVFAASAETPGAVHESVDRLMEQSDEYQRTFCEKNRRRHKSHER